MTIAESLKQKVEEAFQPLHLELENESANHHHGRPNAGAETHFRLLIVSNAFDGVSRVERQRKVQNLFEDERSRGLHALALWTYTPAEWSKIQVANEAAGAQAVRDLSSPNCQSKPRLSK